MLVPMSLAGVVSQASKVCGRDHDRWLNTRTVSTFPGVKSRRNVLQLV